MDTLFYSGVFLLSIGCFALAVYSAYKIGLRKGRREYYEALTTTDQEDFQ
ncbi:MAG TPA: hypothetical protein PK665_15075 [Ignavibacteriaceae bacterium]|nr:hypothetical protein [Ignavibacteriaceae bacterium]